MAVDEFVGVRDTKQAGLRPFQPTIVVDKHEWRQLTRRLKSEVADVSTGRLRAASQPDGSVELVDRMSGLSLAYDHSEWTEFLQGLWAGEFDC